MSLLPVAAALAGLLIGLRTRGLVVRHSVAEGEPLRHACPRCAAALTAPAVLSAGRCPGCRGRIGPPALAVELVTAVALTALAVRHLSIPWQDTAGTATASGAAGTAGTWAWAAQAGESLAYGWLAVVAVPLLFVDVAVHRLPDRLTAAAYLGTTTLLTATALLTGGYGDLLRAFLGGLALVAFYLLLFLVNPSGMGLGDVKLAASLGTALGWLGWHTLVTGAFLGFAYGALYGGALLLARRAGRGAEIPFGPFMILGAFTVVLTGI
ncbi:prepilin peptidase [Streptosporangium carneum]|uniref:Prepilin type IV endopeptidase peptidase domain-containing protein n=1 Tax=Streptosporangium carneum TaxID=47481 RepID=A0A9W6MG75_9ACTN|nr:A24 family peptidase [Streptosporangium carneum]GLK12865.1 hypothetical protein GCM10017600_62750 [Streptosporangium carneum]